MSTEETKKESQTYEAGCHCGYIKFAVTLSPPLGPDHKPLNCNCSACRRFGYLLVCMSSLSVSCESSSLHLHYLYTGPRTAQDWLTDSPTKDPHTKKVTFHGDSFDRMSVYRFNTKTKKHYFCSKCGASIGIDFRGSGSHGEDDDNYGISVSEPFHLERVASVTTLLSLAARCILDPSGTRLWRNRRKRKRRAVRSRLGFIRVDYLVELRQGSLLTPI